MITYSSQLNVNSNSNRPLRVLSMLTAKQEGVKILLLSKSKFRTESVAACLISYMTIMQQEKASVSDDYC